MKIHYCSDLHMEFHENMRFMKSLPLEPVGDVLVIAGDVGYLLDSPFLISDFGISALVIWNVFQFSIEESACFVIFVAFKTLFAANNYEVVFCP